MMMTLLGLHYNRLQLKIITLGVSMHPLLYDLVVLIRRYTDDSHSQLGCSLPDTCTLDYTTEK